MRRLLAKLAVSLAAALLTFAARLQRSKHSQAEIAASLGMVWAESRGWPQSDEVH